MDDYYKQAQLPEEAFRTETPPLPSKDASYEVVYTGEGVYLEINREQGTGKPLRTECVLFDMARRGIDGLNMDVLRHSLRRGDIRIRLGAAQTQKDADSDVVVTVASDSMSAGMMLFPPVLAGAEMAADAVLERIRNDYQIAYGLNEQTVRDAVNGKRYYQFIEIAKGTPPQKGRDGEVVLNFNPKITYSPTILPDGSADFKNLVLFEHVKQGDIVATSIPPEDGIDGFTVKNERIPAKRGKDVRLPKGKNVAVSEDGKSLIAEKSGRVDYINGRIEVTDVYVVNGDVDFHVGNIQFDGNVVVTGNVMSGFSIEATGSIEVQGYVEGAVLKAGKDIMLRNGMQGMSQGRLEAGGNIVARFIERSTLLARGSVYADYLVYCLITAGNSVVLKGKFGKLLGGVVRAGKEVTAKTIGSGNDMTTIELGVMPEERARCTKIEAERGQIKAQLNRIQNITRMPPPSDITPDRLAMREKLIEAGEQLEEQYNELTRQLEEIKQALTENSNARVNVLNAIFPNVKIQIDTGIYTTKSRIEFATFRCMEGQIGFVPCEVKE